MILLAGDKWEVRDTESGALWSEHPFSSEYERQQAKKQALEQNALWKESLSN